jgi:twitching motility two-component system response regulator PilG
MASSKLLIIDDDDDTRESLISLFQSEGFQAEGAKSGLAALAMLTFGEIVPDAILLDLLMPAMNGAQFRSVAQRHPRWSSIPIIVCSADRVRDPDALKVFGVLEKPFDLDDLLEVVKRACRLTPL